jgi:hypothetical protein
MGLLQNLRTLQGFHQMTNIRGTLAEITSDARDDGVD